MNNAVQALEFDLAYESLTDRLQLSKDARKDLLQTPSPLGDFFRMFDQIFPREHVFPWVVVHKLELKDAWGKLRQLKESQSEITRSIRWGSQQNEDGLVTWNPEIEIEQQPLLRLPRKKRAAEDLNISYAVVSLSGPAVNPDTGIQAWAEAKTEIVEPYDGRDGYKHEFLEAGLIVKEHRVEQRQKKWAKAIAAWKSASNQTEKRTAAAMISSLDKDDVIFSKTAKASLQPKNGAWYLYKSGRPPKVLNICPLRSTEGRATIKASPPRQKLQEAFEYCTKQGKAAFKKANKALREKAFAASEKWMQEWMQWRVRRYALLLAGAQGGIEGGGWSSMYSGGAPYAAELVPVGRSEDVDSRKYDTDVDSSVGVPEKYVAEDSELEDGLERVMKSAPERLDKAQEVACFLSLFLEKPDALLQEVELPQEPDTQN